MLNAQPINKYSFVCPGVLLVANIANTQHLANEGAKFGSMQLRTATSRFTFPRQHRPKDLSILQHDIHLIEIKHCEDTRPQKQLSATGNSIKASAPSTKEPPLPSTPSFGSEWHHPQQSLGCGVLPGVVAALSVASL
jgi:hypothetical protein